MARVTLHSTKIVGPIKRVNCVNNGPTRPNATQHRSNFESFAALHIPMMRNHDASHCSTYGGCHSVDVACVFPDFTRDPDDPEAYDFQLTDEYLETSLAAGTQIFYRLGASIEPWSKKYNVNPPADFQKWANICEHMIAHFNEGWANGHHWDIRYWEIWNEPDLNAGTGGPTWTGSPEEFFELYRITATRLKKRFPDLRIGGPALAGDLSWAETFLRAMTEGERTPLDFFSWHWYGVDPHAFVKKDLEVRALLNRFGYTETETNLNEYNYVRGWTDDWGYSLESMAGLKGAAFTAACLCAGQNSTLDVMMYYDARVLCAMNGLFDFYTLRPRKGYYAFAAFDRIAQLKNQVKCLTDDENVYALAARSDSGETALLVCHYAEDDNLPSKKITLDFGFELPAHARLHLLSRECDFSESTWLMRRETDSTVTLLLPLQSFALITF